MIESKSIALPTWRYPSKMNEIKIDNNEWKIRTSADNNGESKMTPRLNGVLLIHGEVIAGAPCLVAY